MIEFKGILTGAAEKRFIKKSREFGVGLIVIALLIFLPLILVIAVTSEYLELLWGYFAVLIGFPLMACIPKSKKEQAAVTPKRIFLEDDRIVCVADKYEESRWIDDVKQVRDCGAFYELVFPMGKLSEKFICQKSLLSKGSLDEFEALFEGKMIK